MSVPWPLLPLPELARVQVTDYSTNISFRPCGNRSSAVCRTAGPEAWEALDL